MTQASLAGLDDGDSGPDLLDFLLACEDALHSMHSGASRPSYVAPGMLWLDTSGDPWIVKLFISPSVGDAIVMRIKPTTGAVDALQASLNFSDVPDKAAARLALGAARLDQYAFATVPYRPNAAFMTASFGNTGIGSFAALTVQTSSGMSLSSDSLHVVAPVTGRYRISATWLGSDQNNNSDLEIDIGGLSTGHSGRSYGTQGCIGLISPVAAGNIISLKVGGNVPPVASIAFNRLNVELL